VGELRFAVRAEGGRSVADLLDRRTRIGLVPADRVRAVPVAERVLAEELPGRGTPLSNRWLRSEGAEATF
jgi:glycerol-3-phosphate dehydrogenase